MNIKGFDALSKHVPELQTTPGLVRALLAFIAMFVATSVFFLAADHGFSEWMPDGEVVIMALGFLVMSRFYSQKKRYQQKYGEMAFRNAFARFNLPGPGIVFASIAHLGYIPGLYYPQESRIVNSSIYSVLRHPTYAAALYIGIGLASFMPTGMHYWSP